MTTRPLSTVYGFDRGQAADRKYIELFLAQNAERIQGRCIEIKDDAYLRRFGGGRVTKFDVLDINAENERANVLGDLQHLNMVPDESYECAIVTCTLQYLRDPRRGVCELHRIISSGGTLLVAVNCIAREETAGEGTDYWRFMPAGVSALFADLSWEVEITRYGNALVGTAIWCGMAVEDLPRRAWQHDDPSWPCIVGVRATKP